MAKADVQNSKAGGISAGDEAAPDLSWRGLRHTPSAEGRTLTEGATFVLDTLASDRVAFLTCKRDGEMRVGKANVKLADVLGAPFGANFELCGKALKRMAPTPENPADAAVEGEEEEEEEDTKRDNRNLLDKDGAQEMGEAEIEAMRAAGASGREIVEALCKSSTTFATKTKFSQAKYIKRKREKYCVEVTVRRPCAKVVCEAVMAKAASRVHGLRKDTLGILLSLANATAHARVLVFEQCAGLVLGAVAERLGGAGVVCAVQDTEKNTPTDIVRNFNLTPTQYKTLATVKLEALQDAAAAGPPTAEDEGPAAAAEGGAAAAVGETAEANANAQHPNTFRKPSLFAFHKPSPVELRHWVHHGFTSVVVAAPNVDPVSTMEKLLPLLEPSAPFVLYSPYQAPLVACYDHLYQTRQAVALQLIEPWYREQQVLENRTHPTMSMHGTGGYLLFGTKVVDHTPPTAKKQKAEGGGGGGGGGGGRSKRARQ